MFKYNEICILCFWCKYDYKYEIFSTTHMTYLRKQMLENMKYNAKAFYLYIQIGRLFVPWV